MRTRRQRYYAVARGRRPGIYSDVESALQQTWGYSGFVLRRFPTLHEATAFLREHEEEANDDWAFFDDMSCEVIGNSVRVIIAGHCERDGSTDAKAAYALIWPTESHLDNCSVLPTQIQHPHTLYCAEYAAVLEALIKAEGAHELEIVTSKSLLIDQLTDHIRKWRKNGWIACTGFPLVYRNLLKRVNIAITKMLSVRFTHLSRVSAESAVLYQTAHQRSMELARS